MRNEADTCREYVVPRLTQAGWDEPPRSITEQRTFTDGRILIAGSKARRGPQKRADYLLQYTRDFPIAVVEAKAEYKTPGTGFQQAKDYAEILDLKFAYATNGKGIVEFDYLTGSEQELGAFPTPEELWGRLRGRQEIGAQAAERLLTPSHHLSGNSPRYYQEIAINRVVAAVLRNRRRILLTMATGTGKTMVVFQICWKLWNARWRLKGEHRRPRILYLADRNILVDDPKDETFAPFDNARWKIENGSISKGREMYFTIYQATDRGEDLKRLRNEREILADRFRAMRGMGLRHLPPEERRTAYDALRLTAHVDEKGDLRITGIFDADLTELLPASWAVAKDGAREYDASTNTQLPTLHRGVVSAGRPHRGT